MNVSFRDCDFKEANFDSCNMQDADIADCFFDKANFNKANMVGAKIAISFCSEACFDRADLSHGIITGTDFAGANREDVKWTGAKIEGAKFDDIAKKKDIEHLIGF